MKNVLESIVLALFYGAVGGALMGFGEALAVTLTSGSAEEYWLFFFAVVSYGALGALIGLGAGTGWFLLRFGRAAPSSIGAVAAAAACVLPGAAVTRYHLAKRVFAEQLDLFSATGLLVHGAIGVGALVLAGILVFAVLRLQRGIGALAPVGLLVFLAGLGGAIGLLGGEPASPELVRPPGSGVDRPNIILIIADTLRADAIEPYGAPAGASPALTLFANESTVFERAYAQSSWTRPSVGTILTGQYPSVHGASGKMDFMSQDVLTLAEALRLEGYWTAGLVTNINVAPIFQFNQGFDEYLYLEPDFYFGATDSATRLAIYKGLRVARERFFSDRMYFYHFYQDARVLTGESVDWLNDPPEPFFLLVHYMDPHDPFFEIPYNGHGVARVMTPDPHPAQAGELHDLYRQDVRYMDDMLTRLFDALRERGLYDDSVIAFTSDHGEEFHEHGGWWHGTTLYDEVVHVPLIVRPPGGQSGRRADPVRTLDIVPTLLGAAGLEIPPTYPGQNLLVGRVSEPIFAEESLEGNELTSVITDGWKLVLANPGNPRGLEPAELYHLETDPKETNNRAAEEPERVARMREMIRSWQLDTAGSLGPRFGHWRTRDASDRRS